MNQKPDRQLRTSIALTAIVMLGACVTAPLPAHEPTSARVSDGALFAFECERLEDVIGEFNRYHPQQLVVADAETANLLIGGQLRLTDLDAFLRRLRFALNVEATWPKTGDDGPQKIVLTLHHTAGDARESSLASRVR